MLVVLNVPKIGIWITLSKVLCRLLFPIVTALCGMGVHLVNYLVIGLCLLRGFAMLGMLPRWLNSPPAMLLLCRVPGKRHGEKHRCGMVIEEGIFASLLARAVSALSLGLCVVIPGRTLLNTLRGRARHV